MTHRAVLLLLWVVLSCAHAPPIPNQPLSRFDPDAGYRFAALDDAAEGDELFVALTFSGGGTRAAALAYAVLRELDTIALPGGRTLLDEIDLISSVSGGSFTSVHYALFGKEGFEEFERSFLRTDVQSGLLRTAFASPRHLLALLRGSASRIELASAYYDRQVFAGRTFGDLAARRRRPFVIVNATELGEGTQFAFTQESFDPLCSDLARLKVADAVAASSAVPGLFTPLVLGNHAGNCGFEEPRWVAEALQNSLEQPARYRRASTLRAYDGKSRPYLNLMDGGLADNLGVRAVIDALTDDEAQPSLRRLIATGRTRRLVVIIVNSATGSKNADLHPGSSSVRSLRTALSEPIGIHSVDSMELLMERLRDMEASAAGGPAPVTVYPIEIAFHAVADPAERTYLEAVETSFALDSDQIDRLIAAGRQLLRASPALHRLLLDLSTAARASEGGTEEGM